MKAGRAALELAAPVGLVVGAALLGALVSRSTEIYFINALVAVSMVVALYVFVGNSGVLSFGHISFVAVGVWTAGVLSVPEQEKPAFMPYLFDVLSDTTVGNVPRSSRRRSSGASSRCSWDCRSCGSPDWRRESPHSPCSKSPTTCSATTRRSGQG
jgi:hypothetical protein